MKLFPVVALSTLIGLIASPAQAQQKLVPAQSEIGFVTRQMGVPVDGKFRKFDAQIAFDPKQPASAKIGFTIDLASASIGTAETEAELLKPDWFDTKKFPQATFVSTGVKPAGAGKFDVAGTLSIKGSSLPVVVPVTLVQSGANTTATGAFTLKRLDFKIGAGDWGDPSIVANDVQVKIKLTLTGVAAL
jgi:polyisoprenoid-binding protein YceI